jgi:MYXO-CTERM domain-containing protein
MSGRWDRAAAAVAVVLSLLLVVGASARHGLDGGAAAPALPTWPLLFVVGAGLVMAVALAFAIRPIQVRSGAPGLGAMRAGPLTLGLSILLPAAIIAIYAAPGTGGPHKAIAPPPKPASQKLIKPKPTERDRDQGSSTAVVGLAGFALVSARRRRRQPGAEPRALVAAGARDAAVAAAIPADPRAAVLAAYARMEAAFASVGLARRPSDAPREYLARLEAGLGGGRAPAARLTELFERARFSPHPVGEATRSEAIGALETLRAELEAPA